jgi:hypothetical protein
VFAAVLSILLVIGGVEQNPGPDVEVESFMQFLCSGCERILKSGTQCGNVKVQLVDSGRWNCERCKWERLCLLEEKLQNALNQIEDLKMRNKNLGEQLRMTATGYEIGRTVTVQEHHEGEKCLVMGDSKIRYLGTGLNNMIVECFPGIRTEQLHRVMDNRDLGAPGTVIIHVGTTLLSFRFLPTCVPKKI